MWSEDKLLSHDEMIRTCPRWITYQESEDGDVDDHNLDTSTPFMPHDLVAEATQVLVKQIMKLPMDPTDMDTSKSCSALENEMVSSPGGAADIYALVN